jgi:hypothetical protein
VGEINVPEHIWKAWPSAHTATTAPTLLKVLVVSGKPFVIAGAGEVLIITTKAANSELSLLLFDVIRIPSYIFSQDLGSWADGIALDKSRLCPEGRSLGVGSWSRLSFHPPPRRLHGEGDFGLQVRKHQCMEALLRISETSKGSQRS